MWERLSQNQKEITRFQQKLGDALVDCGADGGLGVEDGTTPSLKFHWEP